MEIKGFSVVFEDEFILVVDKRSGLLTVPTPEKEAHTLTSLINGYLKAQYNAPTGLFGDTPYITIPIVDTANNDTQARLINADVDSTAITTF